MELERMRKELRAIVGIDTLYDRLRKSVVSLASGGSTQEAVRQELLSLAKMMPDEIVEAIACVLDQVEGYCTPSATIHFRNSADPEGT